MDQKIRLNIRGIPKALGYGTAFSIAVTLIGAALGAWLISSERVAEQNMGYITALILLLSSSIGAAISVKITMRKRIIVCLCTGGAYLLSLFAITSWFFGGTFDGVGESALVILAGVLSVALVGLRKDKSTRIKKIRL